MLHPLTTTLKDALGDTAFRVSSSPGTIPLLLSQGARAFVNGSIAAFLGSGSLQASLFHASAFRHANSEGLI